MIEKRENFDSETDADKRRSENIKVVDEVLIR